MAEIHVERKRRSLWWLWLLIIIILAIAVYIWYTNNQDSGAISNAASSITAVPADLTFLSGFYI